MSKFTDQIQKIFSEGGILTEKFNMEYRPQQEALALKIAAGLEKDNILLAEAGTGVGKSLAYLIPGIIWGMMNKRKFIISTHTKNLQEQILSKDIPFVREILKSTPELHQYAAFKDCLFIGRNNYICTNRLRDALQRYDRDSEEYEILEQIQNSFYPGFDGVRDHLKISIPEKIWNEITADSSLCSGVRCKNTDCFQIQSQRKLESADIIIANHAVTFTLLGKYVKDEQPNGIIFDNDILVFDEGHKLPEVATDFYASGIAPRDIDSICGAILSSCKHGGVFEKLNHEKIQYHIDNINTLYDQFCKSVIKKYFSNDEKKTYHRFSKPNWINDSVSPEIAALADYLSTEGPEVLSKENNMIAQDYITRLNDLIGRFKEIITLQFKPLYCYWAEYNHQTNYLDIIAKPIDVAEQINQSIFNRGVSVTITSATLTDSKKSLERFCALTGAKLNGLRPETIVEASPFDYDNNMKVLVSTDCPEFKFDDQSENIEYNSEIITEAVKSLNNGGTLVLCTSFNQCRELSKRVKSKLGKKYSVFTQNPGSNRPELINQFKNSQHGILFGVSSFWTGIDIPGSALSQLIITKTPFTNPDFPLTKSKAEFLENMGVNSFYNLLVPEAVQQFRQGIGRLIRKSDDKGRLIITDTRLVNKFYGKEFFKVMPTNKKIKFNKNNFHQYLTQM